MIWCGTRGTAWAGVRGRPEARRAVGAIAQKQNAHLKQSELRQIWASSLGFASAIRQATGGRLCDSALVAQARAFLEEAATRRRCGVLGNNWAQASVTPERQAGWIG